MMICIYKQLDEIEIRPFIHLISPMQGDQSTWARKNNEWKEKSPEIPYLPFTPPRYYLITARALISIINERMRIFPLP